MTNPILPLGPEVEREVAEIAEDAKKAEVEGLRECRTCGGTGEVVTSVYCQDEWCEFGAGRAHDVFAECPCCEGAGEIE